MYFHLVNHAAVWLSKLANLRGVDEEELLRAVGVVGEVDQVDGGVGQVEEGGGGRAHPRDVARVLAEGEVAVHLHHDAPLVDAEGPPEVPGVLLPQAGGGVVVAPLGRLVPPGIFQNFLKTSSSKISLATGAEGSHKLLLSLLG